MMKTGFLGEADLPRLFLHRSHLVSNGYVPLSGSHIHEEFVTVTSSATKRLQTPEIRDLQTLPRVAVKDGELIATCQKPNTECWRTPLLLRQASLGYSPRSNAVLIALAGNTRDDVWLLVVDGDVASARRALSHLGTLGAVRLDFSESFVLEAKPLGMGASASVHAVSEKGPRGAGCRLVGKVQHADAGGLAEVVRREVSMLAAVQGHPNVVHFHGLFNLEPGPARGRRDPRWIVLMQRCSGGDLFDAVGKDVYSEARAKDVLAGILDALAHVHDRQIVHRDVKPENVMLTGSGQPILADFGLACHIRDMEQMDRKCGTPGYTAPEILTGNIYGAKVDSFSAGVMLFFLLTAKTPFLGPNIASTVQRNKRCRLDLDASSEVAHVSGACRDFMKLLMQKRPVQRGCAKDALEHAWLAQERSVPTERRLDAAVFHSGSSSSQAPAPAAPANAASRARPRSLFSNVTRKMTAYLPGGASRSSGGQQASRSSGEEPQGHGHEDGKVSNADADVDDLLVSESKTPTMEVEDGLSDAPSGRSSFMGGRSGFRSTTTSSNTSPAAPKSPQLPEIKKPSTPKPAVRRLQPHLLSENIEPIMESAFPVVPGTSSQGLEKERREETPELVGPSAGRVPLAAEGAPPSQEAAPARSQGAVLTAPQPPEVPRSGAHPRWPLRFGLRCARTDGARGTS